jgi:hypothetical protein
MNDYFVLFNAALMIASGLLGLLTGAHIGWRMGAITGDGQFFPGRGVTLKFREREFERLWVEYTEQLEDNPISFGEYIIETVSEVAKTREDIRKARKRSA